jgi:enoyl-CoA hydratase/carnithine racemase
MNFADYAEKFTCIKMRREDGILELRFHTNGGSLRWGLGPHAEVEEAFLCVGRDRENQVVIMCGTGDEFNGPEVRAKADAAVQEQSPAQWTALMRESNNLIRNLLDIDVPMIAAVNGPALRHPEMPIMCDIVLASETAVFQDSGHFVAGLAPGDGVHVVFPMVMGLNRSRYFLLTGQKLSAREAKETGLVNEILPIDDLLPRAWTLARTIMAQPELVRRYARILLTERLRREMGELLPYGLALEGLGAVR